MSSTGIEGDIVSILGKSFRQGQLLMMLKLLFRLRFSSYYNIRKENGFLVIPEKEWLAMCKRQGLDARFLPDPITMQEERKTLMIQF